MLHFTEFQCNQRRQIALKLIKKHISLNVWIADYCSSSVFLLFCFYSFLPTFWCRLTVVYLCPVTVSLIFTWFVNISAKPHPPSPTFISKVFSPAKAISVKMLLPRQLVQETIKNFAFDFLLLLAWAIGKTTALGKPFLNRILSPLLRSTGVCWSSLPEYIELSTARHLMKMFRPSRAGGKVYS